MNESDEMKMRGLSFGLREPPEQPPTEMECAYFHTKVEMWLIQQKRREQLEAVFSKKP